MPLAAIALQHFLISGFAIKPTTIDIERAKLDVIKSQHEVYVDLVCPCIETCFETAFMNPAAQRHEFGRILIAAHKEHTCYHALILIEQRVDVSA